MDTFPVDTRPYWEALQQRRLVIQQCGDCGACRHYPQPMCPHCHSMRVEWRESRGSGSLHSWTITYQTAIPLFTGQVPYVFATVDLPEGVRMAAPLRLAPQAAPGGGLHIGMPVRLVFEQAEDGLVLPAFEAA